MTTRSYFATLFLWARGWWHLDEITYKPGWSARQWRWRLVYGTDYLLACLLGLGCQPVSRWAGERVKHAPWRWLARLLDALDKGHTASAGGLLWGTQPAPRLVRYVAAGVWLLVLTGWALG